MNKEGRPENSGYIGIRDIAKLAGVSTATVSRVINNPEMTSEKVRKKVQKVIEEYNYIPNQPRKSFPRQAIPLPCLYMTWRTLFSSA